MNEISRLFVTISARTDEFHKNIEGVENKLNKVSKKMKIAGGIMVGAVAAIGVASLKLAGDFDGAMREVNTMMMLSADEFKDFSKEIQNFARNMGVNAVEAANALYQAISAGVPKENAVEIGNRALDVMEKENRIREEIKRGSVLSVVMELEKWEKV